MNKYNKEGMIAMNKQSKKKNVVLYILGNVIVAVCTFLAMPKIIDFLSAKMYPSKHVSKSEEEDD